MWVNYNASTEQKNFVAKSSILSLCKSIVYVTLHFKTSIKMDIQNKWDLIWNGRHVFNFKKAKIFYSVHCV